MPRLSNERYERFAVHCAEHRNPRRAAMQVGLQPRSCEEVMLRPEVKERVAELSEELLTAAKITGQRVMLELGRVSFADLRGIYREDGSLKPVHEMDADTAASIAGMEFEERMEKHIEEDLATGEPVIKWVPVRTVKVKRYDKNPALLTLAKHFKLVGDEGDGVNALATALADRLKLARKRTEPLTLENEATQPENSDESQ